MNQQYLYFLHRGKKLYKYVAKNQQSKRNLPCFLYMTDLFKKNMIPTNGSRPPPPQVKNVLRKLDILRECHPEDIHLPWLKAYVVSHRDSSDAPPCDPPSMYILGVKNASWRIVVCTETKGVSLSVSNLNIKDACGGASIDTFLKNLNHHLCEALKSLGFAGRSEDCPRFEICPTSRELIGSMKSPSPEPVYILLGVEFASIFHGLGWNDSKNVHNTLKVRPLSLNKGSEPDIDAIRNKNAPVYTFKEFVEANSSLKTLLGEKGGGLLSIWPYYNLSNRKLKGTVAATSLGQSGKKNLVAFIESAFATLITTDDNSSKSAAVAARPLCKATAWIEENTHNKDVKQVAVKFSDFTSPIGCIHMQFSPLILRLLGWDSKQLSSPPAGGGGGRSIIVQEPEKTISMKDLYPAHLISSVWPVLCEGGQQAAGKQHWLTLKCGLNEGKDVYFITDKRPRRLHKTFKKDTVDGGSSSSSISGVDYSEILVNLAYNSVDPGEITPVTNPVQYATLSASESSKWENVYKVVIYCPPAQKSKLCLRSLGIEINAQILNHDGTSILNKSGLPEPKDEKFWLQVLSRVSLRIGDRLIDHCGDNLGQRTNFIKQINHLSCSEGPRKCADTKSASENSSVNMSGSSFFKLRYFPFFCGKVVPEEFLFTNLPIEVKFSINMDTRAYLKTPKDFDSSTSETAAAAFKLNLLKVNVITERACLDNFLVEKVSEIMLAHNELHEFRGWSVVDLDLSSAKGKSAYESTALNQLKRETALIDKTQKSLLAKKFYITFYRKSNPWHYVLPEEGLLSISQLDGKVQWHVGGQVINYLEQKQPAGSSAKPLKRKIAKGVEVRQGGNGVKFCVINRQKEEYSAENERGPPVMKLRFKQPLLTTGEGYQCIVMAVFSKEKIEFNSRGDLLTPPLQQYSGKTIVA